MRRGRAQRRAQPQPAFEPGTRVLEVDFGDVPLVEHDQRGAAGAHRELGDPQVFGRDALGGVADDERDVGALDGALGAKLRVVVDRPRDLASPPQAGGVDQHHRPAVDLELGVDRVAGRPGELGDDHALGAEEAR